MARTATNSKQAEKATALAREGILARKTPRYKIKHHSQEWGAMQERMRQQPVAVPQRKRSRSMTDEDGTEAAQLASSRKSGKTLGIDDGSSASPVLQLSVEQPAAGRRRAKITAVSERKHGKVQPRASARRFRIGKKVTSPPVQPQLTDAFAPDAEDYADVANEIIIRRHVKRQRDAESSLALRPSASDADEAEFASQEEIDVDSDDDDADPGLIDAPADSEDEDGLPPYLATAAHGHTVHTLASAACVRARIEHETWDPCAATRLRAARRARRAMRRPTG